MEAHYRANSTSHGPMSAKLRGQVALGTHEYENTIQMLKQSKIVPFKCLAVTCLACHPAKAARKTKS